MTWWQAIVLGALQGITEFLPVSSSGHLVLVQHWWPIVGDESAAALFFDGMLHLGTVFSVLAYFWRYRSDAVTSVEAVPATLRYAVADNRSITATGMSWWHWFWLLSWASAPAAVAVLAFPRWIRDSFVSLPMVAVDFVLLGILLWLTDRLPAGTLRADQTRWYHALIIGTGQMLSALFRGLSRSGMTIATALFLGLERSWALRLSFAMSVIANLGLAGLGIIHLIREPGTLPWLTPDFLACTLLGAATSAVVGYLSIYPLLALVRRCRLRWFSLYLWLVAALAGLASVFRYLPG
jgi:undecaprenyl-diphosphatase